MWKTSKIVSTHCTGVFKTFSLLFTGGVASSPALSIWATSGGVNWQRHGRVPQADTRTHARCNRTAKWYH